MCPVLSVSEKAIRYVLGRRMARGGGACVPGCLSAWETDHTSRAVCVIPLPGTQAPRHPGTQDLRISGPSFPLDEAPPCRLQLHVYQPTVRRDSPAGGRLGRGFGPALVALRLSKKETSLMADEATPNIDDAAAPVDEEVQEETGPKNTVTAEDAGTLKKKVTVHRPRRGDRPEDGRDVRRVEQHRPGAGLPRGARPATP